MHSFYKEKVRFVVVKQSTCMPRESTDHNYSWIFADITVGERVVKVAQSSVCSLVDTFILFSIVNTAA